jgi:hypothetical protein
MLKPHQAAPLTPKEILAEFREWLSAVQRAERAGLIVLEFAVPQRVCATIADQAEMIAWLRDEIRKAHVLGCICEYCEGILNPTEERSSG